MVYKNGYLSDSNMEFERVFLKRQSKWRTWESAGRCPRLVWCCKNTK